MGQNNYSTNWVWCLANDLWESAQWLSQKSSGNSHAAKYPMCPTSLPLDRNSRVTIFGHGNPGSTHIMGNGNQWEAQEFARILRHIMKRRVKRISFHMCYGAKATDGTIHSSFVHKFASFCDFAEEVVGRTSITKMFAMDSEENPGVFNVFERRVKSSQGVFKHNLSGGKILYKPQGGTPGSAKTPDVYVINYNQ